jgi:hypothetical protein
VPACQIVMDLTDGIFGLGAHSIALLTVSKACKHRRRCSLKTKTFFGLFDFRQGALPQKFLMAYEKPRRSGASSHSARLGAFPVIVGLAGSPAAVAFAFGWVFALAYWAMQLLTKLRRFKKWMAEYFLAA